MNSRKHNPNGFTLIDLLVTIVMIGIIAGISIPILNKARLNANEASAISSLRLISQSQNKVYYSKNRYFSIDELAGANFVDPSLGSGTKSGYEFTQNIDNTSAPHNYVASAKPTNPDGITQSGRKRFGIDSQGVIFEDSTTLDSHFSSASELRSGTTKPIAQ